VFAFIRRLFEQQVYGFLDHAVIKAAKVADKYPNYKSSTCNHQNVKVK
jgi:hypothetical protein